MDKKALGQALERIAVLLEVKGENPFKVRAFANAARLIPSLPDFDERLASGTLTRIRGIGDSLAGVVEALASGGSHPLLEELKTALPPGLPDLLGVPGLGPKKIRQLYEELKIGSLEELRYAIYENRLVDLPGFGPRTQEKIRAEVERIEALRGRLLLDEAVAAAAGVLQRFPGLVETGGLRRRLPVVDTLEFLAPAGLAPQRLEAALGWAFTREGSALAAAHPETGSPVRIHLTAGNAATALFLTTGTGAHISQLRALGPLPDGPDSEEAIYAAVGLPWIPPEMREGLGEVELARSGRLGEVVAWEDLGGCLHNHTVASDGASTLEEMRAAAVARGWSFLGIADHSRSAKYARGLEPERLAEQGAAVRALNAAEPAFRLFHGVESDLHPDGSLDYPDEVLAGLDYVVGSIHSHFTLKRADQNARLAKALAHPALKVLGHPTGRLLLGRAGCDLDMEALLSAAAEHGKAVEINANPHRLDLDWTLVPRAQALGAVLCVNPDAHEASHLDDMRWGLLAARKGLLLKANCLNAWPLEAIQEFFGGKR
jgi:DNA polymerase (family 10)